MKTHHYIFLTTAAFIVLFYNQNVGLNLGILALIFSLLTYFRTPNSKRNKQFYLFFILSIFSGFAFAWYGDFASFAALVSSQIFLGFRAREKRLNMLTLVPVIVVNSFTFICRVFSFERWLPKTNTSNALQKVLAFVAIPMFFVLIFFCVYASGSSYFLNIFSGYELDLNIWQLFVITVLGFFISFNYWNFYVEKLIYRQNHLFKNDFKKAPENIMSTYSFFEVNSERMSGVISFICLNVMLIFFIATFNYEQFFKHTKIENTLSEETHERVGVVILSIVMAILVIMFYFKGTFNFDSKARFLKILAKIWIVLNLILVFSTLLKNAEYVSNFGLTYKRLGVFAFLILAVIGLVLTFVKISAKKKNIFLVNHMIWYFYGTVLVCSFVNWGSFLTRWNLDRKDFDKTYHVEHIDFNENVLLEHYRNQPENVSVIKSKVDYRREDQFLSKILYYEFVNQ